MSGRTVSISIRLPAELEARLSSLAARTGRSKASYIQEAVSEHIADLEDRYLAEQSAANVRSGRELTYTLSELRATHFPDIEKLPVQERDWPE